MQLNLQVGLHAEDRVQASNVYYSLKIITTGRNGVFLVMEPVHILT